MTGFSWWNVVPSTTGGLIGGLFAVAGMIVSGRRERLKERERRTYEAARGTQQCFLAIEDLYNANRDPDDPGTLTSAGYEKTRALER